LGGLVLWIMTLYCGPRRRHGRGRGREGTGLYPELAVLGFSEGVRPALARQTALLPSYEVARGELADDGQTLDIKEVHRIARRLGAEVLTTRKRDLERYRAGEWPADSTLRGQRVGVAIDGGRVRSRVVIRKQRGKGKGKKKRRRHGEFRRRGVPLGSGAIESAIRRVVNLRRKGNGLLWYVDNAEGMLVLGAAALTGRWQETLTQVGEAMARDRRIDWQWLSPDMPEQLKAPDDIKPPQAQPQSETGTSDKAA
jgi:hypothetical protein